MGVRFVIPRLVLCLPTLSLPLQRQQSLTQGIAPIEALLVASVYRIQRLHTRLLHSRVYFVFSCLLLSKRFLASRMDEEFLNGSADGEGDDGPPVLPFLPPTDEPSSLALAISVALVGCLTIAICGNASQIVLQVRGF